LLDGLWEECKQGFDGVDLLLISARKNFIDTECTKANSRGGLPASSDRRTSLKDVEVRWAENEAKIVHNRGSQP